MPADDEDIVEHMIRRQLEPQVLGRELGIDTPFVYTGPDKLEGYTTVSCSSCGRTAQVRLPPEQLEKAMMCPNCMPGP